MKKVISLDDLVSSDLQSGSLYEKYTALLKEDIGRYFNNTSALLTVPCPGCGKEGNKTKFQKMGLEFKVCPNCASFYVSPRPTSGNLRKFYEESKATCFWRKEIRNYDESHIHHIHGPRINWIRDVIDEFVEKPALYVDYHSKYPSFLEKLAKEQIFQLMILINPLLFEQIELLPKEILIKDGAGQDAGSTTIMTAFEAIERMADPNELFETAKQYCGKDGLLLITAATSSGFEYQTLKENSPNINPVNRMNLLSLEVITQKITGAGFEILELSTPGRLDVEIVRKTIFEFPQIKIDPFWKYLFEKRGENTLHSLQEFLQLNLLSSHVRIAARKKEN